jgi:phenylacetate-coenzyme A ligase PaaK-like adenylate-forming protein
LTFILTSFPDWPDNAADTAAWLAAGNVSEGADIICKAIMGEAMDMLILMFSQMYCPGTIYRFDSNDVWEVVMGDSLGLNIAIDKDGEPVDFMPGAEMRAGFPDGLTPDFKDLAEGFRNEEIEYTYTSGTTSEKVVNIWDQRWWDASEASSWKLNSRMASLEYPQRQAKLASSLNVGINCEEDLPMGHRTLGNTLYLNEKISVLQWQQRHFRRMVNEINEYRPVVLEANPSLLARLAWWVTDNSVSIFSPEVIVFTFEFPSALHLAAIRQVFTSSLVSSYGTTETGFVMQQCEHGMMHQNTTFCRIDFEPLKQQYGGPELGRIFVTTFGNEWNYIIRFETGDLIRLHPSGECGCGRKEGMIAGAIEGRVSNITFDTRGGPVTTKMLDDSLASVSLLRDYHLEQQDRAHYVLQAVLAPGDASAVNDKLASVLQKVYGYNGVYDIQIMETILPGPAGKFRRTQANFEFDENGLFR